MRFLMTLAEDLLSAQELECLRTQVNKEQPECWQAYRVSGHRIQTLTGEELCEHLMFPVSLGEILNGQHKEE